MSSLAKIRASLAKTIEANVQDEIHVYQNVPDNLQYPAVVIRPDSCDFTGAMARGNDTWKFDLYLVMSRADTENAQEVLDDFATSGGLNSIRAAIEDNHDLGLDDCVAFVRALKGYGGEFETARVRHIGAIFKVEVHTDGSQV